MLKDFARLFQAPTACGAGGRPGQIESFVHFFKSGRVSGQRPDSRSAERETLLPPKGQEGEAVLLCSVAWFGNPLPYTCIWKRVPGTGFRYMSFCTRLAYVLPAREYI